MKQRERGRSQQPPLFAPARGGLHERRRVPLREVQPVSANFEPAFQQIKLRALPGAVCAFNHNQRTRIRTAGNWPARLWQRGLGRFASCLFRSYVLRFHQKDEIPLSGQFNLELLQLNYTTRVMHGAKVGQQSANFGALENRHLNAQEFLRILAEITDQQPQIARQPGQVVVKLGIGEKFASRCGVVVQLRGRGSQVVAGVAQFIIQVVVRG